MRSNRLWIGVTCGVALALGVVAAVDAGTQTAGAAGQRGEPADRSRRARSTRCDEARATTGNPFTVSTDSTDRPDGIASTAKSRDVNRVPTKH